MKGICHNDVIPGETFALMDTPIRHVGRPSQEEGKINALFFPPLLPTPRPPFLPHFLLMSQISHS